MYELYNPTILKIETLLLEKRLDEDLSYLIDALPEYSTFSFDMEPVTHSAGKPVPINPLKVKGTKIHKKASDFKVKLKPPPWSFQWFLYDVKGIEDMWTLATPWFKRKFVASKDLFELKKYDLIRHYRDASQELEHDLAVQKRMLEFEEGHQHRKGVTRRKLLKSAAGQRKELSMVVSAREVDDLDEGDDGQIQKQ